MFNLTNKIAVVTGAASGIGKAAAVVLAQQGAHVHLLDMNSLGLTEVVDEITTADGTATSSILQMLQTRRK